MGNITHFDLDKFTGPKLFVETGTGACFSTHALVAKFGRGYTVEIDERLAGHAKRALPSSVEVLNKPSTKALKEICANELEPILFWLDAHYPEGNRTELPLEDELKIIATRNNPDDVILVDDARIYFDAEFAAGPLPPGYAKGKIDFEAMFPQHDVVLELADEGYLSITFNPEKAVKVEVQPLKVEVKEDVKVAEVIKSPEPKIVKPTPSSFTKIPPVKKPAAAKPVATKPTK